jgi:23S rRNA (cytosine1962-C5)-methyltransferase
VSSETQTVVQAILKRGKAAPFFGRHPWVLDTAIDKIEGDPHDGDVLDLVSDRGKWIARGIYNSQSRIRVRLYTWQPGEVLDQAFFRGRIARAIELRRGLAYLEPSGACRLVYSEGDGISGLVVDRYGSHLAVQVTARAMAARLESLVQVLVELAAPAGIVLRSDKGTSKNEGLSLTEGPLWGHLPEGPLFIEEHGIRYGVDLREGQKTGFYLDQRENRCQAARFLAGRRVLDLCCYSGGFSLAACRLGGAREVWGFDVSPRAVMLARENAALNGVANARFDEGDCFETAAALKEKGERFGAVILDPPKFARNRSAVGDALRAYFRLNKLAVETLEPGGVLVTCSCSGHVLREDFMEMLSGVAQKTHRDVQVLETRGASPDHPVSTTCLEGEYLKCFVCRVS